jgi:hypothetical protein
MITNSTIANTDISSTAAIDYSKLATLATGQMLVGNANVPTATTLSGDVTVGATGVMTVTDNSVDGTDIALGSDAQGDVMFYNGTDWTRLAAGTSGNILQTNGAGANPSWAATGTGDITAIGDVTTGAAFTNGVVSGGRTLTYEGSIVDAFDTTLQFSATNPTVNGVITIPNSVTGNMVTTGDTGTVSSTMITDATIATADLANNAVDGTKITLASEAIGDMATFDGTNWVRLASSTAGYVLTGNGSGVAPSWQTASTIAGTVLQNPVLSRRFGYGFMPLATSTTFSVIGINASTATGTVTNQPALAGAARPYIQYATTAVSGNAAGLATGVFTLTRPLYRPRLTAQLRTDATITTQRIHVGLAESTLSALATNTSATTATAIDYVSVAYDTNGTGNTTDWLCCSGDGTNHSCITTGVAVVAGTEYTITTDWTTGGSLVCTVNGTSVSKGTNLSTAAINLGPYIGITTNSAAIRNFAVSKYGLEQN